MAALCLMAIHIRIRSFLCVDNIEYTLAGCTYIRVDPNMPVIVVVLVAVHVGPKHR